MSAEATRALADMRSWLDREIADEERSARLTAMNGGIYGGERLRTLRDVRDRIHWRAR